MEQCHVFLSLWQYFETMQCFHHFGHLLTMFWNNATCFNHFGNPLKQCDVYLSLKRRVIIGLNWFQPVVVGVCKQTTTSFNTDYKYNGLLTTTGCNRFKVTITDNNRFTQVITRRPSNKYTSHYFKKLPKWWKYIALFQKIAKVIETCRIVSKHRQSKKNTLHYFKQLLR